MEYCQSAHAAHDWSSGVLRSTHPQSLRVIDCITLKVVQAPSPCRYVALSYVWGKPEENIDAEDIDACECCLPEELPNTILDAIHTVRQLHLRFLWVDKYCILQSNPNEKHDQ